jgi:hypothetical protein
MARYFTPVRARPTDANGAVYPGAKLYFYISGTTTLQSVYSDSGLTIPLSNPVVADGFGQFVQIFMQPTTYRVDFKTSGDVLINSDDNVDIGQALGTGALPIASGGTGATTASGARTALGLGTAATKDVGATAGQVPLLGASAELSATVLSNSITTLTEDTAPVRSADYGLTYDASAATAKKVKLQNFGLVAQVVSFEDGAVATGTTLIPFDDTIPQNTEGDQYMTLSITPTNAASTLIIDAILNFSSSATAFCSAALFQDSTANALAAGAATPGANQANQIRILHKMTAGTTSSTAFKIRIGASSASTITFNGNASVRRFGGVSASTIVITEILP